MEPDASAAAPSDRSPIRLVATIVAMAGGLLAFALATLVTTSVLMRWIWDQPIPGDFEFVQMGTALVIFAYLPFCQLQRGNIIVDTFTSGLPPRALALIDAFWDLVYAGIMGVIAWAMVHGAIDTWSYGQETMVSRMPLWPALAISTALVGFLSLVALYTAARLVRTHR